jgi:hypothetical protein
LPNHGQDFVTLTVRLNSRLFGVGDEDAIRIDPTLTIDRLRAANDVTQAGSLLP